MDELPVRSIELPKDSEFPHFEKRLPSTGIDEDALKNFVHVLRFAGKVLVIPLHLSGIRIKRQRRVRVERIAVGATRHSGPGLGLCSGPINEVGFGIVTARNPRIAARPKCQREIAPGIAAGFAGPGDGRRTPDFLTGRRVVPTDEADVLFVSRTARHARDDFAADDDRTGGIPITQFGVGDFRVPGEFPCTRIHSNDVSVTGSGKYLVAEDGNISLDTSAGVASLSGLCRCGTILPDQIPCRSIERLNDASGVWQVHDAVVDKRCGFIRAGIVHRPRPGELKLGHILPVNLIERAVAPCIIGAPPVQPIPRRRIPQHGLGHRAKFFDLREDAKDSDDYY